YLPLTGGTLTGSTSVNAQLNVGSNTTSQSLILNGAVAQPRSMFWQTAGAHRSQLRTDAQAEIGGDAGSLLILEAYNYAGTGKGALMSFDRRYGAQSFTPYPVVFSGSDSGSFGNTMHYSYIGRFSGSTTSSNGITFNRWLIPSDTTTDIAQGIYFAFEGD